jgi:hypothetical protein
MAVIVRVLSLYNVTLLRYYPDPSQAANNIKDHVAFYKVFSSGLIVMISSDSHRSYNLQNKVQIA